MSTVPGAWPFVGNVDAVELHERRWCRSRAHFRGRTSAITGGPEPFGFGRASASSGTSKSSGTTELVLMQPCVGGAKRKLLAAAAAAPSNAGSPDDSTDGGMTQPSLPKSRKNRARRLVGWMPSGAITAPRTSRGPACAGHDARYAGAACASRRGKRRLRACARTSRSASRCIDGGVTAKRGRFSAVVVPHASPSVRAACRSEPVMTRRSSAVSIARIGCQRTLPFARAVVHGVIHFVTRAERGRLRPPPPVRSALCGSQWIVCVSDRSRRRRAGSSSASRAASRVRADRTAARSTGSRLKYATAASKSRRADAATRSEPY